MNVALIGFGYWGNNLARILSECGNFLKFIFDCDPARTAKAVQVYSTPSVSSLGDIWRSDVEAVFIATPPKSHYEIAREALLAGKHVFVEKPFATSIDRAYELLDLAEKRNCVAMVDHTFLFAEPVRYLNNLIRKGAMGEIVYISSRRINLGLFQQNVDVVFDLAVHDLAIVDFLVGMEINRVSVFKRKFRTFPQDAWANINLELKNGTLVNIAVSWLSPVKIRETIIGGTEMMAIYDDTTTNKLEIFDRGVILSETLGQDELYKFMVQYKLGNIFEPKIFSKPSLTRAVEHFFDCVRSGEEPISGRKSILAVTRALDIISRTAT